MPYGPRPVDVKFDHAAASAAVDALHALQFGLGWGWGAESAASNAALAGWEGRAADNFRVAHSGHHNTVVGFGEQIRSLMEEISQAIEDATTEQARRERLQANWDAQLARERAAARAAAEARARAAAEAAAEAAEEATEDDTSAVPAGVS